MISGEYSALYNKKSIVCAINKKIYISLEPNKTSIIKIKTCFGSKIFNLNDINIEKPFEFVIQSILIFIKEIKTGFTLIIKSDFSHLIGLGSSAAVTAGTIQILGFFLKKKLSEKEIFYLGKYVIFNIQKTGSFSDLSASIFKNTLIFSGNPFSISKINFNKSINLIYCGYKIKTEDAIKIFKYRINKFKKIFFYLIEDMSLCTNYISSTIKKKNFKKKKDNIEINNNLMTAIGVNNKIINFIIQNIKKNFSSLNIKISGSGLGDCVLCEGNFENNFFSLHMKNISKKIKKIKRIKLKIYNSKI